MIIYGAVLKENHTVTSYEIQDKISKLELETPEERFPTTIQWEAPCEVYHWCLSYDQCLEFIGSIEEDIRELFECRKFQVDQSYRDEIISNMRS